MTNLSDQIIQTIADKLGTFALDDKFANNLFPTVPTDASDYVGMKMMKERTINSTVIKYTAFQPVKGLMKSVVAGTKAPISPKRGSKTEEHGTVKFKDSVLLDEQDWLALMQAQAEDARDAEKRFAAEMLFRAVQDLKMRNNVTIEKLFWDGCRGTMSVPQITDGVESTNDISTNTRTLPALTSTAMWSDETSSSTADPLRDIQTMQESYTGKGAALGEVYCNLQTFNYMLRTPGVRGNYKYSTTYIEASNLQSLDVGGVPVKVYNGSYVDADGNSQTFIPDGVIIGFAKQSKMMTGQMVELIKSINVDSQSDLDKAYSFNLASPTYGEWMGIKTERDPVSTQILFSNTSLPAFVNPQMIVSQTVYS